MTEETRPPGRRARFARARVFPLGQEPAEDLLRHTTAAERVDMVWHLTVEAWSLAGLELPDYGRAQIRARAFRRGPAAAVEEEQGEAG